MGVLLIAAGGILLGGQLGFFEIAPLRQLWPLFLIVIGAGKLAARDDGSRIAGLIITATGAGFLARNLGWWDFSWRMVWPVLMVAAGVLMLWANLRTRAAEDSDSTAPILREWAMFGGGERVITSQKLEGGEVFAMFGGFTIDLTQCRAARPEITLNVTAIFGGHELRVSQDWVVNVQVTPLFGGFGDKTRRMAAGDAPQTRLNVVGLAMFGGIEVRN
ncbi:MAG: hypothetical protein FJW40_27050 [Acidobacteria bacterium]|nr:hypothetical protein [Acidobacteriota bacterium]